MSEESQEYQWYWSSEKSGEKNGPVTRKMLEIAAKSGSLEKDDLVWREGFEDWRPAGRVSELQELFSEPPPLPEEQHSPSAKSSSTSAEQNVEASPEEASSEEASAERVSADGPSSEDVPPEDVSPEDAGQDGSVGDTFSETDPASLQLNVQWEGMVVTNETELELTESGIGARTADGNIDDTIGYNLVRLHSVDGTKVTVNAPYGFGEDLFMTRQSLIFESEKDRDQFLKAYRKHHDAEKSDELIDQRYWYNKKRWALPLSLFMIPILLWNGYEKYFSGKGNREWFEKLVPLSLQTIWCPLIGYYGLINNDNLSKRRALAIAVVGSLLFGAGRSVIQGAHNQSTVDEFRENKREIVSSLISSFQTNDDADEAIAEGERYISAFEALGKKDSRLFKVVDSLKERKAIYMAREARRAAPANLDEATRLLGDARAMFDRVRTKPEDLKDELEKIGGLIDRYKQNGKCYNISGRFEGRCKVNTTSGFGFAQGVLVIKDDCEYELHGSRIGGTGPAEGALIPLESRLEFTEETGVYQMREGEYMEVGQGEVNLTYDIRNPMIDARTYEATCVLSK